VAITVSVFGARQSSSRLQGLGLSTAFVFGIMCMFTPLGVIAGMTGSLFGSALQNEWVLLFISTLFVAMAVSMMGAFELALPSSLTNRLAQVGGVGPKGAFGLGLVCGLIAAPCTGPVLTGILTWIAKEQSSGAGALAMAAFSLGLGFPFFIVGTFAVQLPKSGEWMMKVKSILAIVLLVVALNYLATAFPQLIEWIKPTNTLTIFASVLAILGLAVGAVHKSFESKDVSERLQKGVGTAVTTASLFVLLLTLSAPERELNWQKVPFDEARASAQNAQMPMLVDFTAAWCGACKELDAKTFANEEVSREAGRFMAIKVDATDDEDPVVERVMSKLDVVGLPTVLLFDSQGKEVKRFTDFVEAETFLSALRSVE
jgi:thiol:disulfide interchange protein DsbD